MDICVKQPATKRGVQYEQVAEVAESLVAAGDVPSGRAVRAALGNTGCMGTISRHLRNWKKTQDIHVAKSTVLDPLLEKAIVSEIVKKTAEARSVLEHDLAETNETIDVLLTEAEEQERRIESLEIEISNSQSAALVSAGTAEQLRSELRISREMLSSEQNLSEAARQATAIVTMQLEAMPTLRGEIASLHERLETERSLRIGAEQQAAVLIAQQENLRICVQEARAREDKEAARVTDLEKEQTAQSEHIRCLDAESRELANRLVNILSVKSQRRSKLVLNKDLPTTKSPRKIEAQS